MTAWNLPSCSDRVLSTRRQGIFIKSEFGVTYSQKDNTLDKPKTPYTSGHTETLITKVLSPSNHDFFRDTTYASLSTPCMTPLNISVPFDGDEEDLNKMTFFKSHDTLSPSLSYQNDVTTFKRHRKSSSHRHTKPVKLLEASTKPRQPDTSKRTPLIVESTKYKVETNLPNTKTQPYRNLEYVLYPGKPKLPHNISLPSNRRPVLRRHVTIF